VKVTKGALTDGSEDRRSVWSRVGRLWTPRLSASAVAAACILGFAAGGTVRLFDGSGSADAVWAAVAAVVLLPLTWSVLRSLLRGRFGVDLIALISIAGALVLGEYLAASVIAVMLAGGNALEERARSRARRELTQLVSRAPRTATLVHDGELQEVPVDDVVPGDIVFVRAGAVLPVDGLLESTEALIDESSLTGESLPAAYWRGETLRSGTITSAPLRMRALRKASESAYAALVRLVREAEEQRAPFVRLADRYSVVFLPVTAVVAGLAWAASGDPVRALAVFVVATPCPLILAAPIALLSGVSRAARAGIVVKGATVIERLGSARTVLLDKTGTITLGTPELARTEPLDGFPGDEALRLAASLDQLSLHPFARALVREARARDLRLTFPETSTEHPGRGIEGTIGGHEVVVGSDSLLRSRGYAVPVIQPPKEQGHARALLGIDGTTVAALEFADPPRREAADIVDRLHTQGVVHVAMLTGDRSSVAEAIGSLLRVDRVYAEQSPQEKLDVVRVVGATPGMSPVVMVGDGINDAPALALADVGIAMGSVGATASSETADAVVLVDRVDRVVDAIAIGRRSLSLARQSVVVGMGLSFAAMVAASLGLLAPVGGALLQEAIDVAVIANALRALR
jgi:heavy metal translocating P-type ATPase